MSELRPTDVIPRRKPAVKPVLTRPTPAKFDLANLRAHLRTLSDNELRHFGRDARAAFDSMTGLKPGDPAHEDLIVRIQEVTLEYRRRFRKTAAKT